MKRRCALFDRAMMKRTVKILALCIPLILFSWSFLAISGPSDKANTVSHPASSIEVSSEKIVIGIFGDLHENADAVQQVFAKFRERGVTHVIGTGDYIEWGGPNALRKILSEISPMTGVRKENIFLAPGNWEHETGYLRAEINPIISEYGHLIFANYDSYGYVVIGKTRIMVSHFPQHKIPEELLPPVQFRKRVENQAYVMNTVERGIQPDANTDFEVFAHTHRSGAYLDSESEKVVVNVGTVHPRKKVPGEPGGFAIFKSDDNTVRFFDFEKNGTEYHSVKIPQSPQATARCLTNALTALTR